jgi:hypothetical protein
MNIFKNETYKFLIFYLVFIVFNHIFPNVLGQIFFVISLLFFLRSKDEPFWLALFVLIFSGAAGFFTSNVKAPYVGPFPLFVVFYLAFILKFILKKRKQYIFYLKPFLAIIFLMILNLLIYFDNFNLNVFLKYNIALLLIPLLPSFIHESEQLKRFMHFISIGAIVVFFGQLFHIINGVPIAGFFFGVRYDPLGRIEVDPNSFVRSIDGILVSFIALIGNLYIYLNNKKRVYLLFVAISIISIIITATRGWMIASFIIILPLLRNFSIRNFVNIVLAVVFVVILSSQFDVIRRQLDLSFKRLETVEKIAEGDVTAGGTNIRLTERHIPVWNAFLERPVFGWGYSDTYLEVSDGHVGNQNLLMQVGIIGYFLFLILLFSIVVNVLKAKSGFKKNKSSFDLLLFAIFGVFLIHSTSRQMFGIGGDFNSQFIIAFLFTLANFSYYRNEIA